MAQLLVFCVLTLAITHVGAVNVTCVKSELVDGYYHEIYFQCANGCCGSKTSRYCCTDIRYGAMLGAMLGCVAVLSAIGLLVWFFIKKWGVGSKDDKQQLVGNHKHAAKRDREYTESYT